MRPAHPGETHGQAADPGRHPAADAAGVPGAAGPAGGRPHLAGPRSAAAPPQTLEAVKRLLLRESQEQPLLLVFEDLHWLDTETQALLDSLVESLPYGPAAAARQLPPRVPARLG